MNTPETTPPSIPTNPATASNKLAFNAAAAGTPGSLSKAEQKGPLLDLVTSKAVSFATGYVDRVAPTSSPAHDYYRLEGALAGYLSVELAAASGFTITQGKRLAGREADIVVEKGAEKVVVELKRASLKLSVRGVAHRAVEQVSRYLHEPDVVGAVALIYSAGAKEYDVTPAPGILSDRVRIVAPRANKAPLA